MTDIQGLSAEDRTLVERAFGPRYMQAIDSGYLPAISTTELVRLIDAARSEGATFTGGVSLSSVPRSEARAKPPQGDVGADSGLAAADDNHKALVEAARKVLAEHKVRYGICNDDNAWHDLHRALAAAQPSQQTASAAAISKVPAHD